MLQKKKKAKKKVLQKIYVRPYAVYFVCIFLITSVLLKKKT